jgi:Zn-dependent peptidase ImmA (M78 family)
MTAAEAYKAAQKRAQQVRSDHAITGPCLKLKKMRELYKAHGIQIVYWDAKLKVLRGVYLNDEDGPTVMVDKKLPNDPKIFTLAHELKHHLIDNGVCSTDDEESRVREIAAEVFAAELLLPETLFIEEMTQRGVSPSQTQLDDVKLAILNLKRDTGTTLSYLGLAKRAERLGYGDKGALTSVHWKKMEIAQFGVPFYRQRLSRRTP